MASAIQNYAWRLKQDGEKSAIGNAEIENTTNHQCFKPWKKVPTGWSDRLVDPIDERIATSADNIQLTQYRAGTENCQESLYPANGNILSQYGAKERSESTSTSCGGNETWRAIDEYYYTGTVKAGTVPKAPDHSYTRVSGGIKFNFDTVGGFKYVLEKYRSIEGTSQWIEIYKRGWSWKSRNIPKSHTHDTNSCNLYRVKATNPKGGSPYANYNGGNGICG